MDETKIAFLDQVREREAAVRVVLGDAHDQPQIVLDQPLARGEIATRHRPGERELLVGGQQQVLTDLVQVDLRDIVDDVGAESRRGRGERQLLRPEVRLGPQRRRLAVGGGIDDGVVRCLVDVGKAREVEVDVVANAPRRRHAGGKYRSGSTGLPSTRISK